MLSNIQMLRAFAALNVALFHIISISARYDQPTDILANLGEWGRNGVDIFFVISGFIMVHVQHRAPRRPWPFLANRIRRIVPIYWILTSLVVALYLAWPNAFRSFAMDAQLVLSSLLFLTELQGGDPRPILYVGWTLEYEMLFYVLFAAGLFLPRPTLQRGFVFVSLAALMLIGLDAIVAEFLLGMLCAMALIALPSSLTVSIGPPAFAVGTAGLLLSLWAGTDDLHRSLAFGVPAAFLVFGVAAVTQRRFWLIECLGDASYSIYLVQVIAIPAFYRVSPWIFKDWHGDLVATCCLVFNALVGSLVYLMLERPLMNRRGNAPRGTAGAMR